MLLMHILIGKQIQTQRKGVIIMKKYWRRFKKLQNWKRMASLMTVGSTLAAGSVGVIGNAVEVNALEQVDEPWAKPTLVYGGGLNDVELDSTKSLFSIDLDEELVAIPALGEDLVNYLGYSTGNTGSMISSVRVTKNTGFGSKGIKVDILTPDNITMITSDQYTNAAITAGVDAVKIEVASVRPVTGESALTGVYKALDVNGEELEQDRMEVAQEELETASQIAEESNLDGDMLKQLDAAMVEIKQELSELKERTGELATREDIEKIINLALQSRGLGNVITADHITRLIDLFENYQNTSAIDSEQVKQQLAGFAEDIGNQLGNAWQAAEDSGVIDKVVTAVTNFFQAIGEFLTGFFNN